ncbi:MAG: hypothetical protein V3T70_05270, partial [Phycisphaerae bacterium]
SGESPPTKPPSAKTYNANGLPWFEYYDEKAVPVEGSPVLANLKSIKHKAGSTERASAAEDQPIDPKRIVENRRRLRKYQVREMVS